MSLSMADKITILRQEFSEMDVNHDEFLTQEELFLAIDQKIGKEFDRNVASQLYDRMDKDYDGKITADEFIKVFMEAEEILRNKIDNSKKYLEDYNRQRREAAQKLEEIRNTEVTNSYGIMEGSNLTINITEAQNIKGSNGAGSCDPYCVIKVGNTQQQTNVAHSLNPIWNENFTFNVETGLESIKISLLEYDTFSKNDVISLMELPLSALKDQYKHEEWFDLYDRASQHSKGKIHLVLQWVHSRTKYLSDIVRKWDEHIRLQQEDLLDYERDLAVLYEPFSNLVRAYRGGDSLPNRSYDPYGMTPVDNLDTNVAGFQIANEIKNYTSRPLFRKPSLFITLLYLFISSFVCFNRAAYLDILLASSYLLFFLMLLMDGQKLRLLAGGVVMSFLIDIPWLIIYSKNWWNQTTPITNPLVELHLNRFVIAFSFLLFFIKIVVALLYFHESTIIRPTPSNQDVVNKLVEDGNKLGGVQGSPAKFGFRQSKGRQGYY